METIDNLIMNYEKNRLDDKAFENDEGDNRVLKNMKYSLLLSENEAHFMKDFNKKMLDIIHDCEEKLDDAQKQIKYLRIDIDTYDREADELREQIAGLNEEIR